MADLLQVRRDTAANWTSNDPTLAAGEFGFETDTGLLKIGDGSTAWTSLGYSNAGGSRKLISSDTLTAAASLSKTSLDYTGYTKLEIECRLESDYGSASADALLMYINNDTTPANYWRQDSTGYDGTSLVPEAADAQIGTMPCDGSATTPAAGNIGTTYVVVPDPAGSYLKHWISKYYGLRTAGSISEVGSRGISHDSITAAITQLDFVSGTSSNMTGTIKIYGYVDISA